MLAIFHLCQGTAVSAGSKNLSNKEVVVGFYTKAFVEHKPREAAETYISAEQYIQHNPNVPNGRKAFIDFFEPFFKENPAMRPSRIVRVIAEGNLVALHVESGGLPGRKSKAIVDIFRVENGKIVEHWDVMQDVPDKTVSGNSMF
jgi:predicted SnoaL-like aldol condensation-catalyzing enzyme